MRHFHPIRPKYLHENSKTPLFECQKVLSKRTYIYDRINECPMKVFWPNWMKVAHYYLDFMPRLAPRPGDDTLYVWIRDKVNLTHMRVSWENYQKVKHYLMPKPNMKGARK